MSIAPSGRVRFAAGRGFLRLSLCLGLHFGNDVVHLLMRLGEYLL